LIINWYNNDIIKFNKNFNDISWSQKLYNYINNIEYPPKCKKCNNLVNFKRFSTGYSKFCSKFCHLTSSETNEKRKKTNLVKYGVENIFQSKKIQDKIKQSNLTKYGVENSMQSEIIKNKVKQTNINKYGVENYSQTKEFKENFKDTMLKKYGVDSPIKNSKIKEKIKKSIDNNYKLKWSNLLKISINDIIINDDNIITINNFCEKHNSFNISKFNLINRLLRNNNYSELCTKCHPLYEHTSINENQIKEFLKLLNINIIENNTIILNNKEIDILIPENKLGIEFNGLYWHSNIYKDKNYHLNKTEECEK
jgi:hypothetical protein